MELQPCRASADVLSESMTFLTFLSILEECSNRLPVTPPQQLANSLIDRSVKIEDR